MFNANQPRVVIVTRKTQMRQVVERQGTREQAVFLAKRRHAVSSLAQMEKAADAFTLAMQAVASSIPEDWRRVNVERDELDRFLFAPDDIVLAVGQDGLVANVAKYLDGQPVIGINPDPGQYDGVLCPHRAQETAKLLRWIEARGDEYVIQKRIMASATREDGQVLHALNELFVGHRTHQSARYLLNAGGKQERQSSSGLICATGTGSTGWTRSITRQRAIAEPLPTPIEPSLVWLVREPFPSVSTGTELEFGKLGPGEELTLISEMPDQGVIFADGIETDFLEFTSGQNARLRISDKVLHLVRRRQGNPR